MRFAAILFTIGLTGCGAGIDAQICEAVVEPPEMVAQETDQQFTDRRRIDAEACVHRWAYRLAKSDEAAPVVARAVLERCETKITTGLIKVVTQAAAIAPRRNDSPTEWDRVRAEAETAGRKSYEELSLMRVVEARAGNCRE